MEDEVFKRWMSPLKILRCANQLSYKFSNLYFPRFAYIYNLFIYLLGES